MQAYNMDIPTIHPYYQLPETNRLLKIHICLCFSPYDKKLPERLQKHPPLPLLSYQSHPLLVRIPAEAYHDEAYVYMLVRIFSDN